MMPPSAALVRPEHIRISVRHPRRLCRCGSSETGKASRRGKFLQHGVKPTRGELGFRRLESSPAEDANRGHIEAGGFHQFHVLVPYLLWPLLGVVVATMPDERRSVIYRRVRSHISCLLTAFS